MRKILRKKKPLRNDQVIDWATAIAARFGIKVTGFENPSWKDGMAFTSLIANFRPELIDITKLNPADGVKNIGLALKAAEAAGCSLVLDAEDVQHADDKSIATQVFTFYRILWDHPPIKNPPQVNGGDI